MGDPTSFSLPPGCRFYPSEEQLICYYLTHKNNNSDRRFGFDVIKEIDLYNYDPFDLPETACFRFGHGGRRRHWYCYVAAARVLKSGRRRAGGGFWKRRGVVRDVVGGPAGKVVVGTRKSYVFYLGDSPKTSARTDWVMYEYALIDHHEVSFVLCRVRVKFTRRNNVSDHIVSSCGEESVATVRHIGVQHDGIITSGIGDTTVCDDDSTDTKNVVSRVPSGLASELDDQITTGALTIAGVQLHCSLQPNEPVSAYGGNSGSGAAVLLDNLTAHQLISILEEDFLELDDLASPLSDIDLT